MARSASERRSPTRNVWSHRYLFRRPRCAFAASIAPESIVSIVHIIFIVTSICTSLKTTNAARQGESSIYSGLRLSTKKNENQYIFQTLIFK